MCDHLLGLLLLLLLLLGNGLLLGWQLGQERPLSHSMACLHLFLPHFESQQALIQDGSYEWGLSFVALQLA